MKAQGFDYVPVDPRAQRAALVGTADLSEEDFDKQFGYGITTLYEQYQRQLAELPHTVATLSCSHLTRLYNLPLA